MNRKTPALKSNLFNLKAKCHVGWSKHWVGLCCFFLPKLRTLCSLIWRLGKHSFWHEVKYTKSNLIVGAFIMKLRESKVVMKLDTCAYLTSDVDMAKLPLRKLVQKTNHRWRSPLCPKEVLWRLCDGDWGGWLFYSFSFIILVPSASASSATRPQPGLDPTPQKEDQEPDLMVFD